MNELEKVTDRERLRRKLQLGELVFRGHLLDIHRFTKRNRSGKPIVREIVGHPGATVILPLLEHDEVVLIRNRRLAVGATLWELPAGTLEPGEPPIECAKRELEEETGYRASSLGPLTRFFTSPGFCNEVIHAYWAKGLEYHGQKLENDETIEVQVRPWAVVEQMIGDGQICDAKTLVTLLYYKEQRSTS